MALIGWWPLDGNTEDYTVNKNHGVNSNVTWVNGKTGKAGSFNGNNSAITPIQISLADEFTYSFWVNTTTISETRMFLSGTGLIKYGFLGGNFFMRVVSTSKQVIIPDISNIWTHFTIRRDKENKVDLFINGISYGRMFNDIAQEGTTDILFIGKASDGTQFYSGLLNDIRIYDHALSQKEINDLAKAKILHYTFNKDEDIVYDNSGYKRNGSKAGAPIFTEDGLGNSGYEFSNGASSSVVFPNPVNISPREALTISIWVKRTTTYTQATDVFLVSKPPSWYFYDSYTTGNIRGEVFIDGTRRGAVLTLLPFDNNWYMITYRYDSSTKASEIFKNGISQQKTVLSGLSNYLIDYSTANINNCGANTVGRGIMISDIKIYSSALSDADILDLYQTRSKIDNHGNLYADEIIEDYTIKNNLTLNQLFTEKQLFANNELNPLDGWDLVTTTEYTHNGNSLLVSQKSGYPNSQLSMSQLISYTVDHIYYFRANVLATDMGDWYIYAPVQGPEYTYNFINVKGNNYTAYFSATNSGIYTTNIGRAVYYNGSYWKADYVVLFDLTATFGAGSEPSREQMDTWYNDYITSRPKSSGIIKTREFNEVGIDTIAYEGKTYREIFETKNILHNSLPESFESEKISNISYISNGFEITSNDTTATYVTSYFYKNLVAGNSYYSYGESFSTSSNKKIHFQSAPPNFDLINTTITNSYAFYSNIVAVDTNKTSLKFQLIKTSTDTFVSQGYRNYGVINLTGLFTNIPSKSQMDILYGRYTDLKNSAQKMKIFKDKILVSGNIKEG